MGTHEIVRREAVCAVGDGLILVGMQVANLKREPLPVRVAEAKAMASRMNNGL